MTEIPRLLSGRARMSRIEKDQVLDAVLAEVAPKRRARWLFAVAPALAAAAVVAIVVFARGPSDDFTARGGAGPVAALAPSVQHGKLMFDLHGTTGYRYFAAFARGSDGTIRWYFPQTDAGTSVEVKDGVLDVGIVLGPEHPPGTYHVFGIYSNEPLTRAQLRDRFESHEGVVIVDKELVLP